MNHKKCLYSLLALGLTAAIAHAATPLAKPIKASADRAVVEGVEDGFNFTGQGPSQQANFGVIQSTQFDPADGWDLGFSMCGNEFAGLNGAGAPCCVQGAVTDVCTPGAKDYCGDQNCCLDDPNVTNGWFLNILSKHCNEPHIDDIHPGSSGGQHMRFVNVLAGGTVACSAPLYSGANCRFRFHTPPDRFPGNGQDQLGRSVYSFEIAISSPIGNTRARYLPGFHTEAPGGGGIYAYNGNGLSGVYFNFNGRVQICRTVACPDTAAGRLFLSYWSYDGGEYGAVTIDMDRCNNSLCISYKNSAAAVPPSIPGAVSTACFSTLTAGTPLWTPPYNITGQGYNFYNIIDQIMFFRNNTQGVTPVTLDLDNWKIEHTGCPDACCNANGLGMCEEGMTQTACESLGGRYYPNVQCSQLGDPGYPPACGKDKGSCCNSGPGGAGACTDGVTEADCQGPAGNPEWKTWTKNATCDGLGFPSLCNVGLGACSSGYPGHAAPHFCLNMPGFVPCATDSDCDVEGFCYAGHCTPAAIPGSCEYASAGFCQTMGQCAGGPTCVPADGTPGGCCDTSCATPTLCPGGAACLPIPQPCNAVPQGFDCAFCEGCDAWPTVGCTQIGSSAECPAPSAAIGPGICVANPIFVCNVDGDCPAGSTGEVCVIPAVSPGGVLCLDNDVCLTYITGAAECIEDLGACCESVKGNCEDDVLAADCVSGGADQLTWFKGETCADLNADPDRCSADLGACCNADTFGGCVDTTYNGCRPTANNPKLAWTKGVLCADVTDCTHKAIPTVSEWGIVVLTLLLLVGAKVYFGRRQAATA